MRLIDADALKEEVKTMFCPDGYKIMMLERIDSAPAVDIPTELCKGCRFLKDCETCEEKIRPQGEWELYGMIYYCSVCGHYCGEGMNNFCGNCGADMRGEEK